jgi:hypothetical protein
MLKVIVSRPSTPFAARIASRSVQVPSQVPSPGSAAEFTTNAGAGTQFENSDVLPAGSVAVAVMKENAGTLAENWGAALAKPAALVTCAKEPINEAPSPLPEPSQASLK